MTYCELSDDGKRIEVFFGYSSRRRDAIRSIPGATIYPHNDPRSKHPGNTYWTVPMEMDVARLLREAFGAELKLGPQIIEWGRKANRYERNLRSITTADTAELKRLPVVLPKLYEAIHLGPIGRFLTPKQRATKLREPASFQAADVMFMAVADNPLNTNQPGTGKTIETIGSIFEAGSDNGPQLVVTPKTSMETVWEAELEEWQPHPSFVSTGTEMDKQAVIEAFENEIVAPGFAGWLIVNVDHVRFRETFKPCEWHAKEEVIAELTTSAWRNQVRKCAAGCEHKYVSHYPGLHKIVWNNVIIDEAHKTGLRKPETLTARGIAALKVSDG